MAAGCLLYTSEFIRRDDLDIELAEDEDNGQEQFGYWCRYVKRPATPGSR